MQNNNNNNNNAQPARGTNARPAANRGANNNQANQKKSNPAFFSFFISSGCLFWLYTSYSDYSRECRDSPLMSWANKVKMIYIICGVTDLVVFIIRIITSRSREAARINSQSNPRQKAVADCWNILFGFIFLCLLVAGLVGWVGLTYSYSSFDVDCGRLSSYALAFIIIAGIFYGFVVVIFLVLACVLLSAEILRTNLPAQNSQNQPLLNDNQNANNLNNT